MTTTLPPNISCVVRRRWHAQRGQRNGRGARYKRMPSGKNICKWVAARLIEEILREEAA